MGPKDENTAIDYADIVRLNAQLKESGLRYRVHYKNENTACLEPPGECCLTEDLTTKTKQCIQDYYRQKGIAVHFSEDGLFFTSQKK